MIESGDMQDHTYEPAEGHGLAHDPFKAIIGPRPIGWVSTRSASGVRNLAPYSFFNAFNDRPPILAFASTGWKDTVRNAQETGQFVWNLATRTLSEAMNRSSAPLPADVDEFEHARLTPQPGVKVAADHVAESPVSMECQVLQVQRLVDLQGQPLDTWMVLGQVVWIRIAASHLRDGVYVTGLAEPILRGGASDYYAISEAGRFEMRRPTRRDET